VSLSKERKPERAILSKCDFFTEEDVLHEKDTHNNTAAIIIHLIYI
jgi:hypothetical protein